MQLFDKWIGWFLQHFVFHLQDLIFAFVLFVISIIGFHLLFLYIFWLHMLFIFYFEHLKFCLPLTNYPLFFFNVIILFRFHFLHLIVIDDLFGTFPVPVILQLDTLHLFLIVILCLVEQSSIIILVFNCLLPLQSQTFGYLLNLRCEIAYCILQMPYFLLMRLD